jgi:two-component system response regulator DesR
MPICVLIADYFDTLRNVLQNILEEAGMTVVGTARNGTEAVAMARSTPADIILTETRFPDLAELPLIDGLLASPARIIVLTIHPRFSDLRMMVARGISGIVLKLETTETLIRAIETVHAGGTWIDPKYNPWETPL